MNEHLDARFHEHQQARARQLASMTRAELDQAVVTDGPKYMGLIRRQWDGQMPPLTAALRDVSLLLSHLELRSATRPATVKGTDLDEVRRARSVLFALRAMAEATGPMLEGLEHLFLRLARVAKEEAH